jgi:hypothetical protein
MGSDQRSLGKTWEWSMSSSASEVLTFTSWSRAGQFQLLESLRPRAVALRLTVLECLRKFLTIILPQAVPEIPPLERVHCRPAPSRPVGTLTAPGQSPDAIGARARHWAGAVRTTALGLAFAARRVVRVQTKPPDLNEVGRLLTIKNDYFEEKFSNWRPELGSNFRSTVNSLSLPFESVPTPVMIPSWICPSATPSVPSES